MQRAVLLGSVLALVGWAPAQAQKTVRIDRGERPAPTLVVSATPTYTIGRFDGGPGQLLVNPLGAASLSDGTVVVRDGLQGAFALHYYEEDGSHRRTVSRWGKGPFEFTIVVGFARIPGDSVLLVDLDTRYATFGPDGEHGREGRLVLPEGVNLPPGNVLIEGEGHVIVPNYEGVYDPAHSGERRGPMSWWRIALDGTGAKRLFTLQSTPGVQVPLPAQGATMSLPYPYVPETTVVHGGGVTWAGQADEPFVTGYDLEGNVTVRIEFMDEPAPVGRAERREFRDRYATSDRRRERLARYGSVIPFPSRMPVFGRLEVDDDGNVWVERYQAPWSEQDRLWDVFNGRGEWLHVIALPVQALPPCARAARVPCDGLRHASLDHVLIDNWDPNDVRRIHRFEVSAR